MLSCSLNFENLEQILSKLRSQIANHGSLISDINSNLTLKTSDRSLGDLIERMCIGIHKEVGEKPHKFKLDDKEFLRDSNQGPID